MKLIGQAWVYRVGNSVVRVENAFAWIGWAQERLVVNDETAQQASSWFGLRRDFHEDWLTPIGEGLLTIRMWSRVNGLACELKLDGQAVEPEVLLEARWSGPKRSWPAPEAWTPAGPKSFISGVYQPPE